MKKINNKLAYFSILKFIAAMLIAIFLHYGDHLTRLLNIGKPFPNNAFFDYITVNSYVFDSVKSFMENSLNRSKKISR